MKTAPTNPETRQETSDAGPQGSLLPPPEVAANLPQGYGRLVMCLDGYLCLKQLTTLACENLLLTL